MSSTLISAIVSILVVIVAPALAFLGAKWAKSGTIRSSEAKELWDESGRIREEQRKDIDRLEAHIVRLQDRISKLYKEKGEMERKIARLERDNTTLMSENIRLEGLIASKHEEAI